MMDETDDLLDGDADADIEDAIARSCGVVAPYMVSRKHMVAAQHIGYRPDVPSDEVVWDEIWREDVYRLRSEMLRPGGLVVDVGANVGAFTLLCLAVQPHLHVVVIEPEHRNLEVLRENIRINGVIFGPMASVSTIPNAIGGGEVMTYMEDSVETGGSVVLREGDTRTDPVVAQSRFLEDVVPDVEVDVLKIDCEGCEWDVFDSPVIQRTRFIAAEFHQTTRSQIGRALGILTETHCVDVIGRPSTGGMIWAHQHGV